METLTPKTTAQVAMITTDRKDVVAGTTIDDLELQGGHAANICYTERNLDKILAEDLSKTKSRIEGNKVNKHHSVFGHSYISIYFENMPKIVAMLINNEHEYNTSEKSGRFSYMHPSGREYEIYQYWLDFFTKEIQAKYRDVPFVMKNLKTLATENARYQTSATTNIKILYTTSYRQWCYLYHQAKKMLEKSTDNILINAAKPGLEMFVEALDKTNIIGDIPDRYDRDLSLFVDNNDYPEEFKYTYSTNYKATISCLAHNIRHRGVYYTASLHTLKDEPDTMFYTPKMIRENEEAKKIWLEHLYERREDIPQALLLNVHEASTYDRFLLKLDERFCSHVLLETLECHKETLEKYINALRQEKDVRYKNILMELESYQGHARCLNKEHKYRCTEPCGWEAGMKLKREI